MASKNAVATCLKMLSRAFAGMIDEARAEIYHAALDDLTDEQLALATVRVIKTHRGDFIPPPAVLRHAAGANEVPAVDVERLLAQISKLAVYSPHVGMIYPSATQVCEHFGEAIADAYASAGGARVFIEFDDVGQSIARREFKAAVEAAAERGAAIPLLRAGARVMLKSGS